MSFLARAYWDNVDSRVVRHYQNIARNLQKTLVYRNGISPLGLLRSCLDYAMNDNTKIGGVFESVKEQFQTTGGMDFLTVVMRINDFRNTYIAHQEQELKDVNLARENLGKWIAGLKFISSQP